MGGSTQNTNLASKLDANMSRQDVSKTHGNNVLQKMATLGKRHNVTIWDQKKPEKKK